MTLEVNAIGVPVSPGPLKSPGHSFEQRCSSIVRFDTNPVEGFETRGKRTDTRLSATQQQPPSARGRRDPGNALVPRVGRSSYEPILFERPHQPRHRGWPHLLSPRQIAERDWTSENDYRQ